MESESVIKAGYINISKLKGSANYQLWKFEAQIFLEASGLFGIVSGTETRPLTDDEKLQKWLKNDASAKKVIVTTIEKPLLTNILTCETSAEMWATLKSVYGYNTNQEKSALFREFYAATYTKGDVMSYVAKLENLFAQLRALDHTLKNELLINKILQSLPDSWRSFVTGFDFLPETNKTLDTLKNRIVLEQNKTKTEKEEPVAFFGSEKRKCYRCN